MSAVYINSSHTHDLPVPSPFTSGTTSDQAHDLPQEAVDAVIRRSGRPLEETVAADEIKWDEVRRTR